MFAVGYFSYEGDAAGQLRYIAENTASDDVDIVVIITSVLTVPSRQTCMALPANAVRSPNVNTPTLDKALPIARADFGRGRLTVAFSFQMGVVTYFMNTSANTAFDALYKECIGMAVSDYSQACQTPPTNLQSEKIVIGLKTPQASQTLHKTILQSYDTLDFMKEKAMYVMNTPNRRENFTWFLFNVHLTDFTGRCLTQGPFERVKGFRDFYHAEWHSTLRG
ncbi:uncharacterized protein LOC144135375 [Amblyomma americanum]